MTTTAPPLSAWRTGIITGSRLPAILGQSPYNTRDGVLREMVREHFGDPKEFQGSIATRWGQAHEADAIAAYEAYTGYHVYNAGGEQQLVMHSTVADLGVTPDALVGWDGLVEAKAPFRAVYSHIDERPDYETQLRLELDCTGRDWGDFVVWSNGGIHPPSRITYDPDWLPGVLPAITEFMAQFHATIADEALAERHRRPPVDQRADDAWLLAAAYYREDLMQKQAIEKRLEAGKTNLVELAGDERSTRGGGILLTRSEPKGTVSHKAAADHMHRLLPEVDLEQFRGEAPEPRWTVRLAEDKAA